MYLIRGLHNLDSAHRGYVASIGNFDGVHLGHQAVLSAMQQKSQLYGLPSLVITFEPQPQEYFRPAEAPARLTRVREKLQQLKKLGIHRVLLLKFGRELAQMSASQFLHDLLIKKLAIKHLYVGDDFRFGQQRQGNFDMLQQQGEPLGLEVASLPSFAMDGERVSSTAIRAALAAGNLQHAARLLGRPFSICGRVIHGHKRGRSIGFPTLNIPLQRLHSPLQGVFAVYVEGLTDTPLAAVANIGKRPTLAGEHQLLLEVHVFDFNRQVYGKQVSVRFAHRLRDEIKFASFDELRQQIEQDAQQARSLLKIY
ncbi:MAG: bifunctional riboflavin kinase/FAD synthetase [gamma proteobacterium symbiont of Bathyaustriella thionipta]|nr:bifunctional riboflavin kinase/FAD synthetase [gamma proteobacterium symbiont of Bathyaustriella thionipta]